MANFILVQLLVLFVGLNAIAKTDSDRVYRESYLGEKNLDGYAERYMPLITQDIYRGKLSFKDDVFFQNYFSPYLFQKEGEYADFLRSELNGSMSCSNEQLSEHFDSIQFAYRLITLSYLLENQWHMRLMSDSLRLKGGCKFDLKDWVNSCVPKSKDMKTFLSRLQKFSPKYDESIPVSYMKSDWLKELSKNELKWQSQYHLKSQCEGKCNESNLHSYFKNSCEEDQRLMTLICSEEDSIQGLSTNREAYYLIGTSNFINALNKKGEAMGCLRRFAEVMSHREVRYENLKTLFPLLQAFLRQKYQERFLQGRVFFFGSGKEFEEKGLSDLFVKDQPLKIAKLPTEPEAPTTPEAIPSKPLSVKEEPVVQAEAPKVERKEPIKEIKKPTKSAFLIAAEVRKSENLEQVEVDMLKLKYDYIFSLNMINTLSQRLKTFMTREALKEMTAYDKLGTKDGPVPLLFLKYMIDMEEHQGLWNLISVVGDKFYVSNEIDSTFSPGPELVQLINNQNTGNQWQLVVLRP